MGDQLDALAETRSRNPFGRILAILLGVSALTATILGTLDLNAHRHVGQATTQFAVSQAEGAEFGLAYDLRQSFRADATDVRARLASLSQARGERSAFFGPLSENSIAVAEDDASGKLRELFDEMTAPPRASSGIDPFVVRLLSAGRSEVSSINKRQDRAVTSALHYTKQRDRIALALTLVAFAAVLLGLAGLLHEGAPGWLAQGVAAAILLASMGSGGIAVWR